MTKNTTTRYMETYGVLVQDQFERQATIWNLCGPDEKDNEEENYINPVHKFIDDMETTFENF